MLLEDGGASWGGVRDKTRLRVVEIIEHDRLQYAT